MVIPRRRTAPRLSPRFEKALVFANTLHRTQIRKGTTIPYASHLLGVASIALEHGASEDEAIAALLHDAVEDQGGPRTRARIKQRFGEKVARIVDGCTDADSVPKPPWKDRKLAYIAHLATTSPSVLLVSCSDKLHNARSILADYREHGEALWPRFNSGREGILWYYRSLVKAFRNTAAPRRLVDELDRTVTELEHLSGAR